MHLPATRVVYRNRPYLVELNADGSVVAAFGPFAPGSRVWPNARRRHRSEMLDSSIA